MIRRCVLTLLLLLTAAAPALGQPAATLTYHGALQDRTGAGRSLAADGNLDTTFRVDITGGAPTLSAIRVVHTGSNPGTWVTTPESGHWVAAVALTVDGPIVNQADGSLPAGFTSGRFYVFLTAGDGSRVLAGREWHVEVTTTTGPIASPVLALPFPPTPLPTPTSTDDDADTVPNAIDVCKDTPAGAIVLTSGPWIGCLPDTSGPVVEWLYPKPTEPTRGYFPIAARATDAISGIAGMVLYIVAWPGSTPPGSTTPPTPIRIASALGPAIAVPWESRISPGGGSGAYTFRADAVDERGNLTTGAPVTFTIDNSVSMPAPAPVPITVAEKGALVLVPIGATAPAGYVRVADLGSLGVLYAKQ